VGPVLVIEVLEFPERVQEVALVPDKRAVQELVSAPLHPAFHDRIHSRHLDPAEHDFDARIGEDCSATFSVSAAASLPVSVCATAEAPPGGAGRGLVFMVSAGCSFC